MVLENREWRVGPGELEVGLGTWYWGVLRGEFRSEWGVGSGDWGVVSRGGDWGLGTGDLGLVGLMN